MKMFYLTTATFLSLSFKTKQYISGTLSNDKSTVISSKFEHSCFIFKLILSTSKKRMLEFRLSDKTL